LVVCNARPSFADHVSACSRLTSSGYTCTYPDQGEFSATAKVGVYQDDTASFSYGEMQVQIGSVMTYHGGSGAYQLASHEFDCPDGGSTEYFGIAYIFSRYSGTLGDGSYGVRMSSRGTADGTSWSAVSNTQTLSFNCP
jgi:hypothetical protein